MIKGKRKKKNRKLIKEKEKIEKKKGRNEKETEAGESVTCVLGVSMRIHLFQLSHHPLFCLCFHSLSPLLEAAYYTDTADANNLLT